VITRIGKTPVHIEFYNSLNQLVEEKASLLKSVKSDGLVILNADDEVVAGLKSKTKNKVVTFGFNEEADMQASNMQILYKKSDDAGGEIPDGLLFRLNYDGNSLPVAIEGAFGQNHVYSALVALSVASGLSLNMVTAGQALKNYETPPGRNKLLEGVKKTLIIDDTYNSSPVAAEAAVKTLEEMRIKKGGKKIAVLGDMLELGKHTDEMHKELGKIASKVVDVLVTVGPRARLIAEGALNQDFPEDKIFQYDDSRSAGKFVEGIINDGDIILVKGSQGVRMERAVEEIMAHPENKEALLVRQDPEWLKR
jgi:UDP-N-acetylmuramoyl-tripeptide--D-alanyl-D-alanine ligase